MSSVPQSGHRKRNVGQEGSSAKKAKREEDVEPVTYFTELYAKLTGEFQQLKDAHEEVPLKKGEDKYKDKNKTFSRLRNFLRLQTKVIAQSIANVRDLKAKGQIDEVTFGKLSETGGNLYDLFTDYVTPQEMLEDFNASYHRLQEVMAEENERRKTVKGGSMSRNLKLKNSRQRLQYVINRYKLRFEDIASGIYENGVDETVKNRVTDALQKIKDYEAQRRHHNLGKSGQEEGDVDSEDGDELELGDDGNPVEWNSSDDAEGDIEPGYYADKHGYPHREGSETEPM